MVVYESRTPADIALKKRESELIRLTHQTFEGLRIITSPTSSFAVCFDDRDNFQVLVFPARNRVMVTDKDYYYKARRLAQVYEKQTCESFFLRTEF